VPSNDIVQLHRVAIGIVRKSIGLEGLCAVEALGNSLKKLYTPVDVFLGISETASIPMVLEHIDIRPKGPVCRFAGITDVDSATPYYGSFIFIDVASLPELCDDSYYHFELIGLKVQTDRGNEIGTVVAVHNFPTVDSVEVNCGNADTLIIPLTTDAIVDLDRKSGYLTIRQSNIEDLQ
jgi:16S rRNA processing protein RimM